VEHPGDEPAEERPKSVIISETSKRGLFPKNRLYLAVNQLNPFEPGEDGHHKDKTNIRRSGRGDTGKKTYSTEGQKPSPP